MTIFSLDNMKLHISKDETGNDRFTREQILEMHHNNETIISDVNDHYLCRKNDGTILAEIQKENLCIEADDGQYYINPIISNTQHDFIIYFTHNNTPELVIKCKHNIDIHQHALNIILDHHLHANIISEPIIAKRWLKFKGHCSEYIETYSLFLEITSPIPSHFIVEHDGIYDGDSDCILIHWPKKIQPVQPLHNGQRLWPTKKPWTPTPPKRKKHKQEKSSPHINLKKMFFMPTSSGGKIASIIKEQSNNSITLYVYNYKSLTFDIEITVPNLTTPITI